MATNSVIIGSPHALNAEGISRLLTETGYAVGPVCHTPEALLESVATDRPDLVLLDACFLDPAMERVTALVKAGCTVAVVLDLSKDPPLKEAMLAGAKGCLSIDISLEQFVESLSLMLQGAIVLSAGMGQLMVDASTAEDNPDSVEPLTRREQQLAVLVARGQAMPRLRMLFPFRSTQSRFTSATSGTSSISATARNWPRMSRDRACLKTSASTKPGTLQTHTAR